MKKLTKNDIIKTSGSFTVQGSDKKMYTFSIVVTFLDESKKFGWCIAKPAIKYPLGIDKDSAVLFKVVGSEADPTKEIVELVQDDKTIDQIFGIYNDYVDSINKKVGKK